MTLRKKKIVYLIGSMRRGGAEGQVVRLLRHFRNDEYESSLYLLSAVGDHLEELRSMGVTVRDFDFERKHSPLAPFTALRVLATISDIQRALERDRPDILHGFLYWANIFGALAGRRAGTPAILTSRRSLGVFKDGRPLRQWIENWSNRKTDLVTVNSVAVREDALRRERLDPARVRLIYNGVERAPVVSAEEVARFKRKYCLEELTREGGHVIVCVANLIHYKGHLTLLDAMRRVVREHPKCHLLLVGRDGGMKSAIQDRMMKGGLGAHVSLLGAHGDLDVVYAAADAVVLPSEQEGFSNVILEAMAAGRAIVATRVGGIPEAIEDGRDGLLVPSGDPDALAGALLRVVKDDALRARLGEAARHRAETEFSMETMFGKYEALYREAMEAGRGESTDGAAR